MKKFIYFVSFAFKSPTTLFSMGNCEIIRTDLITNIGQVNELSEFLLKTGDYTDLTVTSFTLLREE